MYKHVSSMISEEISGTSNIFVVLTINTRISNKIHQP